MHASFRKSRDVPYLFAFSKFLRLLVLLAIAVSATGQLTPIQGGRGTTGQTGGTTSGGTQGGGTQGPGGTVIVIPPFPEFGGGPSNCNAGHPEDPAKQIDKNGPQLPQMYSMSSFTFRGFTKGNWPIHIAYYLKQDSLVLFLVTPEGQSPITYRLDGKMGSHMEKVAIPDSVGGKLVVALYSLQTFDGNTSGSYPISPAEIRLYGIAAGPKAVGSIGIDHLVFEPNEITKAQHQKAQYSYHSISDFDDTEVSFVELVNFGHGGLGAATVANKSTGPISQDKIKSDYWDGSVDKRLLKNYNPEIQQSLQSPGGHHALQVKAWRRANHGGDFVAAISEQWIIVH